MRLFFFFFLALTFTFTACNDDDATPDEPSLENRLNYDGSNLSAPALSQGKYEAMVRFTSAQTAEYEGRELTAVEVYFVSVPASTEILIYGQGTNGNPGDLLYSENVSTQMNTDSWNTHTLTSPISIGTEDIWISVKVDHPETFGSVGCDAGPANANGDLMYVVADNTYTTLRQFTNGETDINWNIRGVVGN